MTDWDGSTIIATTRHEDAGANGVRSVTTIEVVRQRSRILPLIAQALVGGMLVGSVFVNVMLSAENSELRRNRGLRLQTTSTDCGLWRSTTAP